MADAPPEGSPAPPAEPHRSAPRHSAGRSALHPSLLWPLAAVAVLVVLGVRASRATPLPGEGLLAAEGFSLTGSRAGLPDPALSPDGLGALHAAVYATLTRAFARHDTLLAAGREIVVVATVLAAVVLWQTGRRLGLPGTTCATAVVLAGVPALLPPAALVDSPARLAVPWLVAAGCLVAPGRPTATARALAGGAATVAVLLAPVTLLLLLAGATAGLVTRREWWGPAVAPVPAAGFVAVFLLLDRWDPRPATTDEWGVPTAVVWSLAGLFVVVGLLAARRPSRFRVAGVALAVTGVLAVVPPGRLAVLAIGLPLAALLVVTVLPVLAPARARSRFAVAPAVLALLIGGAAAVVVPGPGPHPPDAGAADAVLGWASAQLPQGAALVAERRVWAELLHRGGSEDTVRLTGTGGSAQPFLTVTEAPVPPESRLVARFDSPGTARPLQVADPRPGVPTAEELDRRRSLAAAILANPTTETGPQARAVLAAAAVDQRLLSLLAALVAREGLGIAAFPPAPGEPDPSGGGSPARRVLLTALGGQALRPGTPATRRLTGLLEAQQPPFAPDEVTADDDGVLVGFRYVSDPDAVVTAATP